MMTAPTPQTAYLGLGSNLGDSLAVIGQAIHLLDQLPHSRVLACSSAYRSAPWGVSDQPDFVNAVVALRTRLDPLRLLDHTQALEKSLGRVPTRHWGERVIDLDILLYGQHMVSTPELAIPHPWLGERAFVLLPLLEIAPGTHVPGHGSARDLWQKLQQKTPQPLQKIGKIAW